MDRLGISPGVTVADVGAGGGWFTVRAAKRVGPTGLVYAVEINSEYVERIQERAERDGFSNVRSKLGGVSDPGLPERSIDVVLLLKTYHELSEPLAVMQSLRRSLKPAGRLGVIDRNGRGDDHGIDEDVVRREIEGVGFTFRERHDLKSEEERVDYFLVFTR
jgi:ubiquinone/menaquinone biosynthesis C-methylase UbiE